MNELHKYATFSVDLLGSPKKINSMFSIGRARIFYKGINRNRSIIDGEVAEKLASTIPGTPVIGTYNYETGDFEGHEADACAYGFIPLDPHMEWVTVPSKSGKEREYLEVDVVIWDGRFEEAQSILTEEKSLSMELNPKTMRGTFEKIDNTTYYKVTTAEFAGITVLGDDVEPCFEDAQFITAYSKMVSAYALYVENLQENNEGGKVMEENTIIVEPEVATEEVVEEVVAEEAVEEIAEVEITEQAEEAIETETEEVVEEAVVENEAEVITEEVTEVEEAEEVETEIVETVEETSDDALEFSKEEDEEACPECGKNPCVCKSACNNDKHEVEEESDDDKKEDEEKCNEDKYEALKAEYELLEQKYNEALNSLNAYSKKEKLEIISKFSTKLESEELIEKLTNEVDNYTVAEIKSELGAALVEQISAECEVAEETSSDTNFSLNINLSDNSLGNTAWDLVKRHKESK